MKKIVFFMPLMALSFMASCKSSNICHEFAFFGNCCSINGSEEYSEEIKENDSKVFYIKASLHHTLPEEIVSIPSGVVYEKFNSTTATLTIPKMEHDYRVYVVAPAKEIEISFKSFYNLEVIDTAQVPSGTKWSEIVAKPTPKISDYHFNGWSLETTGGGILIDNDYVFNDDTTVYGSYDYICSLANEEESSLSITNLKHTYGEDIEVTLAVKPDKTDKYELPLALNDFTITTKYGVDLSSDCTYERGDQTAKLTIPYDQVDSKTTISVGDYQPTYAVTVARATSENHLKFYDPESTTPTLTLMDAKKGENYYFRVEANRDDSTNATGFYIPSNFKIYIGESTIPLDPEFYSIEPASVIEEIYTIGAFISIDKSVIKGPIVIDADAYQIGYYQYEVMGVGGIKSQLLKYAKTVDSSTIILEKTEELNEYEFPKIENIYVKIDGEKSEIKSIDNYPNLFTYNRDLGHIIIARNNPHASFMFYVGADEYPFLKAFTWANINTISINGYAPYFFNIGDTKTITIDEGDHQDNYEARILEFNRDPIAGSEAKAGITFDLTTTIINFTTKWEESGSNRDFPHSTLNKCLMDGSEVGTEEGVIYKKFKTISDDSGRLVDFIKVVNKSARIYDRGWKNINYSTKLFPGSSGEVWDPYTRYKCYSMILHSSAKGVHYWLRTPQTGGKANQAMVINPEGGLILGDNVDTWDFYVAPFFCI